MNTKRLSLLKLLGLPVAAEAKVERWGTALLEPDERIYTLMLTDVSLNGRHVPDVDHVWVRLGVTGSGRFHRLRGAATQMRCELDVTVAPYVRDDGTQDVGFSLAQNVYLIGEERHLINRRPERVHVEGYAREEERLLHNINVERARAAQADVMGRLLRRAPRQRHLRRALDRYYVQHAPVTPGELRCASEFLKS